MEMILKHMRIRNYVRYALRYSEKKTKKLYIQKFNPFYKWRVGNLLEEEIKETIIYFFKNNEVTTKINNNIATAKAFSLLLNSYKKEEKNKKPETLTNQDWLSIRNDYEKEIRKECENTFGTIGLIENIDYGELQKNESAYSNDALDSKSYHHTSSVESNSENEIGKTEWASIIKYEIENILDEIYQGNWVVKIVPESKSQYSHRFAILNLYLPEKSRNEIFNMVIESVRKYFKGDYNTDSFQIRRIGDNTYLEGYFSSKE